MTQSLITSKTETGNETGQQTAERSGTEECPECGCADFDRSADQSELVCESCGLVVEESRLNAGRNPRRFSQGKQKQPRTGRPTTQRVHDKGLTTDISSENKDSYGNPLPSRKRARLHRLRKWQERIRAAEPGEGNLQFALGEIDRMASSLCVPRSVREIASVVYRRALDANLVHGRSIEAVATTALYIACRKAGISRSLDELAEVARVDRTKISRAYRDVLQELDMEMEPVDPKEFIPRFCSALNLPESVREKANEVIDATVEEGVHVGKSPTAIAAGAIYTGSVICDEKRIQREIADVALVSTATVRNHYHEQIEALGLMGSQERE